MIGEWTDQAQATDLRRRTGWRALMQEAAHRRIKVVLVARLDRAFRSITHALVTVEQFKRWGVSLISLAEPWANTADGGAIGELVFTILGGVAQFEKALIRERIMAGLERARRQGKTLGRPSRIDGEWSEVADDLEAGRLSVRAAARRLRSAAPRCNDASRASGRAEIGVRWIAREGMAVRAHRSRDGIR